MAIETLVAEEKRDTKPVHLYIERKEGICGSEPVIVGTRLTVRLIAGWYKAGKSADKIVAMYPHVNHAQVYDALSYYYDHKDEIERSLAENTEAYWMEKTKGQAWRK